MTRPREIGSIFQLPRLNDEESIVAAQSEIALFALCREAILAILMANREISQRVLLPSFTCQSVIDPFLQFGSTCHFYPIDKNLRIDIEGFVALYDNVKPGIVLAHPFFGRRVSDAEKAILRHCKQGGSVVIGDFTQCLYDSTSAKIFDYCVCSLRKWFPVPDGAYLLAAASRMGMPNGAFGAYQEFVAPQAEAMRLRGDYFASGEKSIKERSIALNKEAERIACKEISIHRISALSQSRLSALDVASSAMARKENYQLLENGILAMDSISLFDESQAALAVPLYFPLRSNRRAELQDWLAKNDVYAPVLWPVETESVLVNDEVAELYETVLAIPCDQRYGGDDMRRIACLINEFSVR